jgi:hypothetical protein
MQVRQAMSFGVFSALLTAPIRGSDLDDLHEDEKSKSESWNRVEGILRRKFKAVSEVDDGDDHEHGREIHKNVHLQVMAENAGSFFLSK